MKKNVQHLNQHDGYKCRFSSEILRASRKAKPSRCRHHEVADRTAERRVNQRYKFLLQSTRHHRRMIQITQRRSAAHILSNRLPRAALHQVLDEAIRKRNRKPHQSRTIRLRKMVALIGADKKTPPTNSPHRRQRRHDGERWRPTK